MTLKVYSVKSNARRDARKLGLDPLSVVAEGSGFIIGALRVAQDAQLGGKQAALRDLLASGWKSRIGKTPGLIVERKRESGILLYRVVRS